MEEGALEVIPSSNPASQACLSEDEALWLMAQRGKCLPLDEAFSRSSVKKMYKNHEAHFILEEVLFIDPVVQFRKDLKPELQNILSRCRTLVVPDPLLASQAGALSQEFMFGHLVLYDGSSVQPVQTELMPEFTEDFTKVPLLTEESLMLPVEVETNFPLTEAHRPSVANLTHMLNIGPALVEDQTTCMDIFKTPPAGNLQEIPDFKTSITPTLESLSLLNPSAPGHCRTYADLEMDFTLSPPHRPESLLARLPSFELQIEQLSPGSRQQFLPEDEKRNIEHAVWMSEKHHLSVARFVLAEPLLCIPALCNAPIAEVSRLLGIKSSDSINVQSQLHLLESECLVRGHSEFTENMSADKVVTEKGGSFLREDFLPLSHMQIDELLTKASQAVETKVEHKDKSDQMEVSPVVVQNLQDQQEGVDGEEHPYNIYCVPESYFTRIESEVAPSTRVRKVCQSVFLKGQDDLDPLSSFMALRIQQNLPQQNISNISESQKTREQMPTEGVTFKSPQLKSKESCNVDAVSCEGNRNTTGVIPVEASGMCSIRLNIRHTDE
ncbi:uncharacterized protein shoc1 isoform X1 [Denticeps clupeoides]|uniref:uncharacterized protein shoc1 isoform X1 n=1 Tax=Denticeps clupeoides TaxID=299321 RepID=UPI0010A3F96B|nr:protein shortage in chiasmata 1 ortholog isoform X1 [Denticeps clupeoides]